jgi:tRNA dimethylallyltransferase
MKTPSSPKSPLWAIVGPTASGKSALALALATQQQRHLISVDAVQVYRGFDIGSAKPSAQERAQVPHHGIDVTTWQAGYDAQRFVTAAEAVILAQRKVGQQPILCGGTGLYLRALRYGLIDAPHDTDLRQSLEVADVSAPGTSLARLQQVDPVSAASISPQNGTYLRRALEITLLTGRPASVLRQEHAQKPPRHPIHLYVVDRPDDVLRERIARRTQAMLARGLIEEVEGLKAANVPFACGPMQAVGYRQVADMLRGVLAKEDLARAINAATWLYVRRQRIWLRREQKRDPTTLTYLPCPNGEPDFA